MALLHDIRLDYRRYRAGGIPQGAYVFLFEQSFWAICLYRVSRAVYLRAARLPVARTIAYLILRAGQTVMEMLTGISLPVLCEIGPGLHISHFGGIILNNRVRLGRNCNLHQGVTIGTAGKGEKNDCPVLGDRVFVGANAVILGDITIGDDAVIGAGAVVVKSVPPRAVVAGNPARILSEKGSFELIRYDGMESDPARMASLNAENLLESSLH